ncbi:MAG: glycan-binding surface protein [Proteiniphilum sp.]|uniref:glycan-binding surface protein n=1 Tax=Proteiniphilum sp. TaxID=1926877 RepID=UPI002ABC79D6|nr:glycan-binding surface protein [Proteiniphilum sp.]MDY9917632.1 glycan-binding surface protein [Proteiniphilum sp.]
MKNISRLFAVSAMVLLGTVMTACVDEPDKYEVADGLPTVKYVRMTNPAVADSLIDGAYMANTICLVGDNLRSIYELYFNDQKAILNTSLMTDHTVIVDVPKTIPANVTNKIYMVNINKDTVAYDFKVLVPAPQVRSMSNEYAKPGSVATIYGDYLLDDANVPLEINFPGNVAVTEFLSISKTAVRFVVPEGAELSGNVTVKSIYGTGRSNFHYMDARGFLFDWDGIKGLASGHGWRNGVVSNSTEGIEPLDGNYLVFSGNLDNTAWPDEDRQSFNYWPEPTAGYPELSTLFDAEEWRTLQLKFECFIPASTPWTTTSLQMIFTSNANVTYATGNNGYIGNDEIPRGLWTPWLETGSYDTADEWVTVTVPLSNFIYTRYGAASANSLDKDSFTGLTFVLYAGPQNAGTNGPILMGIDNIRVVPAN